MLSRSRSSGGYCSSNSCWSSTASSSRVMISAGPMSAASRPRMAMTCSSISSRIAWISASLGAEGSADAEALGSVAIEGLGSAEALATGPRPIPAPATLSAQERDGRDHDDGHEDQDQAMGSGHRRHSSSPAARASTFRFLKVRQARRLDRLLVFTVRVGDPQRVSASTLPPSSPGVIGRAPGLVLSADRLPSAHRWRSPGTGVPASG